MTADGDDASLRDDDLRTNEWPTDAARISRRAADILDALNDAVSAFDAEWRWVYLNPSARALLRSRGKDPDLAIGRVLWDELPMLAGTPFETEARRAVREMNVVEYEEYVAPFDEWLEHRIVPTRGLVTTHSRDITQRRRAERAIELGADRARRLLAVASRLGSATTPQQVAEVALSEALGATGAQSGSVAWLLTEPGSGLTFEIAASRGITANLSQRFNRFPLTPGRPLSDAIITRKPVLIESQAAWVERYSGIMQASDLPGEAMANIPVVIEGEAVAGISLIFNDARTFDEGTQTFLATIGEQMAIALGRARAFERERRALDASAFLAAATSLLVSSLDYEATLKAVAESAVPRLGDWCAVDIVLDPDSKEWPPRVERLAMVHQDPAKIALAAELDRRYPTNWSDKTGLAGTIRDRHVTFAPRITDEMLAAGFSDPERFRLVKAFGITAAIIVPLVARDRTLGAISLATSESDRSYDESDLTLARELAHRAALAIDNARLYRDARTARAEAEDANTTKADFLATMSHELRTPLNAIGGYADLLDMGLHGTLTEQQRDAIRRIKRAHLNLLGLVENVLNFARIESGRLVFQYSAVPLDALLGGLDALIAPQIAKRGLRYEYSPVDSAVTVWADPEKLEQVVLNLLTNALKFTERGKVSLSAIADDDHAFIRVRDTGVGIPAAQLEAIFQPFVQLESGLTRRSEGSGLGLAICRDIARAMNGEVTVMSTPGEGSTFTLRLSRRASSA